MIIVRKGHITQQEIREIRDAIKRAPETALDIINEYIIQPPCKRDNPCRIYKGNLCCNPWCKHVVAHKNTTCVTVGDHEVMTARHTKRQMDSQSERIRLTRNMAKVAIILSIIALAGTMISAILMWLN